VGEGPGAGGRMSKPKAARRPRKPKRKAVGANIAEGDLVRLLECVQGLRDDSQRGVTTREVATALALSSSSVAWYWIEAACQQGLLKKDGTRSVRLTLGGNKLLEGWTTDSREHLVLRIAFYRRRLGQLDLALKALDGAL